MKERVRYLIIAATLMFGSALVTPAVLAQGAQSAAPQGAQAAPAFNSKDSGPPPTDAELRHFVDAAFQVQAISKKIRPQYAAAKTDADRAKVKRDAEAKMASAVRHNRLTVDRYKQIFVAMKTNDGVRKKIHALVQKKRGKQ